MIRNRETAIEAAIVHAECRSQEEAVKLYSTIDRQNEELISEIVQLDEQIGTLEEEIDKIARQKRSS